MATQVINGLQSHSRDQAKAALAPGILLKMGAKRCAGCGLPLLWLPRERDTAAEVSRSPGTLVKDSPRVDTASLPTSDCPPSVHQAHEISPWHTWVER